MRQERRRQERRRQERRRHERTRQDRKTGQADTGLEVAGQEETGKKDAGKNIYLPPPPPENIFYCRYSYVPVNETSHNDYPYESGSRVAKEDIVFSIRI